MSCETRHSYTTFAQKNFFRYGIYNVTNSTGAPQTLIGRSQVTLTTKESVFGSSLANQKRELVFKFQSVGGPG